VQNSSSAPLPFPRLEAALKYFTSSPDLLGHHHTNLGYMYSDWEGPKAQLQVDQTQALPYPTHNSSALRSHPDQISPGLALQP